MMLIIGIATVILIILANSMAKSKYENFLINNANEDMLFILSPHISRNTYFILSISYMGVYILLFFLLRSYSHPIGGLIVEISLWFISLILAYGMITDGIFCVIGFENRLLGNSFFKSENIINATDDIVIKQNGQKKIILKSMTGKIIVKSKETIAMIKQDDGTYKEQPLYSAELMFDNNPITSLINRWKAESQGRDEETI